MDTPLVELWAGLTLRHAVIGIVATLVFAFVLSAVVAFPFHLAKRIFGRRAAK